MPESMYNRIRQTGGSFYCPTGCHLGLGEGENDKLKKQLEAKTAESDRRWKLWRDTEKQLTAQKAATTRIKNRVAAGVCPCCKRTVKQMAAHMKSKHPDYKEAP
jgi:hypothetical protein